MHEAQLHQNNCFITLTYNDEHLPEDKSLHHEDFQKFLKRFRKSIAPAKIRYYMAGEYGENFGRAHFHACIFGYDFYDKKLFKRTASNSLIYTSEHLSTLWPYGYATIGDVNFESAAYVARYVMKKITGKNSEKHYTTIDPQTGELQIKKPEYNKMSLKPGIGAKWLEKYKTDVYPNDYVIVQGRKQRPPRYYDKILKNTNPFEMDEVELKRYQKSHEKLDESPERLAVKEIVHISKLKRLKRELE
jgi:hypothetical protein